MALLYAPHLAAKAVRELTAALQGFADMEYANALLADQRMTNTKGLLASCGVSYKQIKEVRDVVSGELPTFDAQKRARAYFDAIDAQEQGGT